MANQDLTLAVQPGEMTLEEFDRTVRGFRGKLLAYGDVFKVSDRSPVITPISSKLLARTIYGTSGYNRTNCWVAFNVSRIRSGTMIQLVAGEEAWSSKPFVYDRKIHAPEIITITIDPKTELPKPGCKYSHLFAA